VGISRDTRALTCTNGGAPDDGTGRGEQRAGTLGLGHRSASPRHAAEADPAGPERLMRRISQHSRYLYGACSSRRTLPDMFGPARGLVMVLFAATCWSVDDALCRR
jgi:hypothetical protein